MKKNNTPSKTNILLPEKAWHTISATETIDSLQTSLQGLTGKEAKKRLQSLGANEIKKTREYSLIKSFFRQFNNALIYTLLASSAIAMLLGHWVDFSVILGVVLLNAIFGCFQEGKAEEALQAIQNMLAATAQVIRDGMPLRILASDLVPGDIVLLQSGDKIPADLRIIESKSLQTQEAALTGESLPVEKNTASSPHDTPLSERFSIAYSGTIVTYGRGKGAVIATGSNTVIGKISMSLSREKPENTPLIKQINAFGRWLTAGILILATITFAIGFIFWHEPINVLFMATVGITVAAIPEGLPAIMTIILAIGVTRMAKKNAIVRRLPAVETMGAITTICTDKTGTLTRNELSVQEVATCQNVYCVKTNGKTIFHVGEEAIDLTEHLGLFFSLGAALLCNEAILTKQEDGEYYLSGDPLDSALWSLGVKTNINTEALNAAFPRIDILPFDPKHRMMATLHQNQEDSYHIYIKGSPEQIINLCDLQKIDTRTEAIDLEFWHNKIDFMAKNGERVIAIAYRPTDTKKLIMPYEEPEHKFIMLALFGLLDAPRPESKEAVTKCHAAGINVKMITGDHVLTAANIAKKVGILNPDKVLTGKEIEHLSFEELKKIVNDINVYARTTAEDKLRLVKALKSNDQIVAMTGDGVNDSPALLRADIGIAMGHKGTEAAKEAAAMVLTDDNFATITAAIYAGRTIYDNLKKAILYVLPTSIAQAMAIVVAILFGQVLPITPVQILWINMVTTVTLSLALAFEPSEKGIMERPPRKINEPILSSLLIWRTSFVSLLITIAAFAIFFLIGKENGDLSLMRTSVVNMIVCAEITYLFNCRKIHSSSLNLKTIYESKASLLAVAIIITLQMALTYLPFMQHFFGTKAMDFSIWIYILSFTFPIFFLVELEKFAIRLWGSRQLTPLPTKI